MLTALQFCRAAQEIMSSTASNYDVPRLALGTILAITSFCLALITLYPGLKSISAPGFSFALTVNLYGVLMFASSYVEEEHHFWYWSTSAWSFYLFISSSRARWFSKFIFHPAIMLLFLHRIARRWNQTGQKYAGAPDIVHSPLLQGPNSIVLWSLIGATYMDIAIRLAKHVSRSIAEFDKNTGEVEDSDANRLIGSLAILPLGATAFVFKLAFTAQDSPELVQGINEGMLSWVQRLALVDLARMIFGGIALSGSWIAFAEWRRSRGRKGGKSNGGMFELSILSIVH